MEHIYSSFATGAYKTQPQIPRMIMVQSIESIDQVASVSAMAAMSLMHELVSCNSRIT